jgi:GAF domain-containing protein
VHAHPRYGWNPHHRGVPAGHPPVRSYLAVPVATCEGRLLGALLLGHGEPAVFTARSERLAEAIAAQIAVAIDHHLQQGGGLMPASDDDGLTREPRPRARSPSGRATPLRPDH